MAIQNKQIILPAACLLLCLTLFEFSPTDLWLQRLFFNMSEHQWILSRTEPVSRFLLYDGCKYLLIMFAVSLLISLTFCNRSETIRRHKRGIRIVILSLILVPLSVACLKTLTNVACPKDLTEFGGNIVYIKTLEHYPASQRPATGQRCFPAAHASGGFALMSLFFLFESVRGRRRALYCSLGIGWAMGGYKMLIGDHFLSHTIVSMLLAWLIINTLVMVDSHIFGNPTRVPSNG